MIPASASVIVVSRHRPEALQRCLLALTQQDHPNFEVVVVADPAGIAAVGSMGLPLRLAVFDEANISVARNVGLTLAAGEITAFIDDDAVAEATWLKRLCAPFSDLSVVASTGFVRGRNGISHQWKAAEVDRFGQDHLIEVPEAGAVRAGTAQRAVKTQGTNCAFRTETLRAIGGFNPGFRFFLDEADVNLRLAPFGSTALIPLAEVHHGFAASVRRRHDRVPLDLTEIAASSAIFLRLHAPDADPFPFGTRLRAEQGARLQAHRQAGRLDGDAQKALMDSLEKGWAQGMARDLPPLCPIVAGPPNFTPLPGTGPRKGRVLHGLGWRRTHLLKAARAATKAGQIVTVFCFSLTARAHWNQFHREGFWWQEGGLFGRSDRQGQRFQCVSRATRVRAEICRLAKVRPLD